MMSVLSVARVFWQIGANKRAQATVKPVPKDEPAIPAIPTIFPNVIAKQHSDDIRRQLLSKTETKDLYCIAPLLNKQQAAQLFGKIRRVLNEKKQNACCLAIHDAIISQLDNILASIRNIDGTQIPIEAWADISLQTEQVLQTFRQFENHDLSGARHLQFIKLNLERLEFVSRYMWMQLAHKELINSFTQEFAGLVAFDPAFNTLQTKKMNVEVSTPIDVLSISAEGGVQRSQYVDDEGYLITTNVLYGGIALNAKIPISKLTGQGSGTKGTYQYSRFAEAHAICNFNELLAERITSSTVSRYASRAATLNRSGLFNTNELADFYATQKDYVRDEKLIARSFSLLLSLDYSRQNPATDTKVKAVQNIRPVSRRERQLASRNYKMVQQPRNLEIEEFVASRAQIKTVDEEIGQDGLVRNKPKIQIDTRKKAVLLSGELTTATGTLAAKVGIDESFAQINASGTADWTSKKTRATRYLTFCDLLNNPNGDARDCRLKEKLRHDLATQGEALRERLYDFWFPPTSHCNPALTMEENIEELRKNCRPDLLSKKTAELLALDLPVHRNMPRRFLEIDIQRLIENFEAYSNLHAQHGQGHYGTLAAINAFHDKYGAKNTERCLQQMAMLAAYFYTQVEHATTGKLKDLRDKLLKLETDIHATGIPHRPDIFRKLANAQQDYFIKTDDKTFQGTVKCSVSTPLVTVDVPEIGIKVIRRSLLHFNPLRSGEYTTFDLSIGPGGSLSPMALSHLSTFFKLHNLLDISSYLPKTPAASATGKIIYTFKFFKPAESEQLPSVMLFRRELSQFGYEISPKVTVPIPGFAWLTAGFTQSQTTTHTTGDTAATDSVLPFATHYLHGLFTTKIEVVNRDTGEDKTNQRGYWDELVNQKAAMTQSFLKKGTLPRFFLNLGRGSRHRLHDELKYIEKRFLKHASFEERNKVAQLVQDLLVAARNFRRHQTQDNYDETLRRFKKYLQNLFVHWMRTRESSEAYGVWKYSLDDA